MRFDFGNGVSRFVHDDENHRVKIRMVPSDVTRRYSRIINRETNLGKVLPEREHIDPRSVCGKTSYNSESGYFSIEEGNALLHMLLRYLSTRFTLEEMAEVAAGNAGITVDEYIRRLQDRFGEIRIDSIRVDNVFIFLEWEELTEGEKKQLVCNYGLLVDENTNEELISALSPEEIYYTATLRKMILKE